jgi:hypothetical protein
MILKINVKHYYFKNINIDFNYTLKKYRANSYFFYKKRIKVIDLQLFK